MHARGLGEELTHEAGPACAQGRRKGGRRGRCLLDGGAVLQKARQGHWGRPKPPSEASISPSNRPASVTHSASLREAPPRHHPVMNVIAQHPGLPVKYEPRHWRSEAILRATMVPNPTRPKAGGLRLLLGPRQRHILHSLDTSSSMN